MPRLHGHTRLPGEHEGILVWWVEDLHFLEKTSGVYPCGNVHMSVGVCRAGNQITWSWRDKLL